MLLEASLGKQRELWARRWRLGDRAQLTSADCAPGGPGSQEGVGRAIIAFFFIPVFIANISSQLSLHMHHTTICVKMAKSGLKEPLCSKRLY